MSLDDMRSRNLVGCTFSVFDNYAEISYEEPKERRPSQCPSCGAPWKRKCEYCQRENA